jgi:predicted ferric reductase
MVGDEKFKAAGVWLILNVYAPLAVGLLVQMEIFAFEVQQFISLSAPILIIIFNGVAASKYRQYKPWFYVTMVLNFFAVFLLGHYTLPASIISWQTTWLAMKAYYHMLTAEPML